MPELRELQRKLDSVEGLREVVAAMRNLSAVYVRRAEAALEATRPYADIVETALRTVLARSARGDADEGAPCCLAVVFGSEQGLCGAYNDRVVRAALAYRSEADVPVDFAAVGRRVRDLLALRDAEPVFGARAPTSLDGIRAEMSSLAADIFDAYTERKATRMVFVYNAYESMGRFAEKVQTVLPPCFDEAGEGAAAVFGYGPLLTAPAEALAPALVEEYFFVQLCRALFESHCSENGARLLSMTAASGNIDDRCLALTREFQSVRQDTITAELLDVVAGAEALRPVD